MHLKLITHENIIFDDDVDEIYTRGIDGEFGILENHVPIMSALDIGITKAIKGGKEFVFTTMGGILQFKDNQAVILTDIAEISSNINVMRAKDSLQRAEARLADKNSEIDVKRAEASLARAKARLKASVQGK